MFWSCSSFIISIFFHIPSSPDTSVGLLPGEVWDAALWSLPADLQPGGGPGWDHSHQRPASQVHQGAGAGQRRPGEDQEVREHSHRGQLTRWTSWRKILWLYNCTKEMNSLIYWRNPCGFHTLIKWIWTLSAGQNRVKIQEKWDGLFK